MRILIFGINYAPELTGIGKYTGEMGAWLAARGHEVAVITAVPYYPEWVIHPAYKGKRWFTEIIDGVTVYRVPIYVPQSPSAKRRILHEFSFLGAVLPKWFTLLLKKKYEIVININPPFHLGFFALMYSQMKRSRLITHVQDLQIDAAKDLGMINNKSLLRWMFRSERYLLDHSDLVTSISLGMQRKILAKGVPADKFVLFPNWVDEEKIRPLPPEDSLRKEWGIPLDDQVILYAGNMGEKQGLEIILDAALFFLDRPKLHFILVGTGGNRDFLQRKAKVIGLRNVHFYPLQPYERLESLLATADIHLVIQKKSAADLMMPSKLTGILAAGGAVLATALPGTSLHELIGQYGLGVAVEPESAEALAKGVEQMLESDLLQYRQAARNYAEEHLAKDRVIGMFEQHLLLLAR